MARYLYDPQDPNIYIEVGGDPVIVRVEDKTINSMVITFINTGDDVVYGRFEEDIGQLPTSVNKQTGLYIPGQGIVDDFKLNWKKTAIILQTDGNISPIRIKRWVTISGD